MPQCFALDYRGRLTYFALGGLLVALLGCRPGFKSIAPEGLAPTDPSRVEEWVAGYTPGQDVRYDLRWTYRTARGSTKNRAAIRISPPDSLRLDFRGPFGKSGAAVVIGDSGVWSRPEGDFKDLLRAAPLFWAALGMPRAPGRGVSVLALETPERRAWRYAGVSDTFDFVELHQKPRRLLAEMRRGGRVIGRSEAEFNEAGDQIVTSQLDFPTEESRFNFTVDSVTHAEAFGPDIWRRP